MQVEAQVDWIAARILYAHEPSGILGGFTRSTDRRMGPHGAMSAVLSTQ